MILVLFFTSFAFISAILWLSILYLSIHFEHSAPFELLTATSKGEFISLLGFKQDIKITVLSPWPAGKLPITRLDETDLFNPRRRVTAVEFYEVAFDYKTHLVGETGKGIVIIPADDVIRFGGASRNVKSKSYSVEFWEADVKYTLLELVSAILPLLWVLWFGIPRAVFIGRWLVELRRLKTGKCVHCGYDLRATPHRCPECGKRGAREQAPGNNE